jgi:hypothetical protein
LLRLRLPVVAASGMSLALLVSACGIGFATPTASGAGVTGDDAALSAADAGAAGDVGKAAPVVQLGNDAGPSDVVAGAGRSPLCGPLALDDAGGATSCARDPDMGACTPAPVDAGEPEGDAGTLSYGCHVTATHVEAGTASVMATCGVAGSTPAEQACYASSDCAPGLECVIDASRAQADSASNGGGVCRQYCCGNSCEGKQTFCEIETTVGGAVSVPVCVSPHSGPACKLLDETSCATGLTCQIVNQYTGQVACVTPGTAAAGGSCETSNCAPGLSCILGYFPARECAQLCLLESDNCPSGETCTANAAISSVDSQIGTCSQ